MKSFSTPFLLVFLCISGSTLAQNNAGGAQNSLLPEINPQDIEIRSEFRARFPGLRRQPILGFNPKPRVFQVDPNRMPFMESRDEAVASIAITQLDRPEPPAKSILEIPLRQTAYLKTGFGSYLSPEAEGYFYSDISQQSSLSGSVSHQSSGSHLERASGFRYLNGDIRYRNKVKEDLTLTTELGILSDFNRMYDLNSAAYPALTPSIPAKNYFGTGANIHLQKKENSLEGWEAIIHGNFYDTELTDASPVFSGTTREIVAGGGFSKSWAGAHLYETMSVQASLDAGSYDNNQISPTSWLFGKGGFQYRRMFNFNLHLNARAEAAYLSDGFENKLYFAPEVVLRYNLRDAISITGKLSGTPGIRTVQDHQESNRFLFAITPLRQHYTSGAYGRVDLQLLEGNRIFGGVQYEITRNYAYFTRSQENAGGLNPFFSFFNVQFDQARIFELFAGITQQLVPDKFWFDGKFTARSPKLDNGSTIPYHERVAAEGSLSYKITDAFTVNSWVSYIGRRVAPSAAEELDGFLLINAGAEYRLNNKFGVYVKLLNILGQNYELWNGYQERPFQAFGGVTVNL